MWFTSNGKIQTVWWAFNFPTSSDDRCCSVFWPLKSTNTQAKKIWMRTWFRNMKMHFLYIGDNWSKPYVSHGTTSDNAACTIFRVNVFGMMMHCCGVVYPNTLAFASIFLLYTLCFTDRFFSLFLSFSQSLQQIEWCLKIVHIFRALFLMHPKTWNAISTETLWLSANAISIWKIIIACLSVNCI